MFTGLLLNTTVQYVQFTGLATGCLAKLSYSALKKIELTN